MDHSSLTIHRLKKLIFCPELRYFRIGGDDDDDFDFGDNEWENVFVTTGHATQRNRQKRQMYEAAMAPKIEWGQKGKVDKSARKDHKIVKYRPELLLFDSSGVRIIFLQKTHSIEVDFDTKMVKTTHMIQKMFTPQMLW